LTTLSDGALVAARADGDLEGLGILFCIGPRIGTAAP
jgi:hypothetical protein